MFPKKGHLSLFLVSAYFITIIFLFMLYLNSLEANDLTLEIEKTNKVPSKMLPIKNFVELCLSEVSKNGVYFIASRGGYFNLPNPFFTESFPTAFYVYKNKSNLPKKEIFETEISEYIDNQIKFCINDFNQFKEFNIEGRDPKTNVSIYNDSILIEMNLPLSIFTGSYAYNIDRFRATINDDRLTRSLFAAHNISLALLDDPSILCLTCFYKNANQYGFDLEIESYEDVEYLFQLVDRLKGDGYIFNFAVSLGE